MATAEGDDRRDGQMLERVPLALDDGTLRATEQAGPEARARLADVEMYEITYWSDGLAVKGFLVYPKSGGPHPCIIYNRGGNREAGAITPEEAHTFLARVASWGYLILASQYRGNAGGEGREEFAGADVNDVLNLLPLLDQLPEADASRIGMWGWSRGGLMTYRALARTDRIAAAIAMAAVTDAFDYVTRRPDMEREVFAELIPAYRQNKHAALEARSPLHWARQLCKQTPILVLHGGADWRVHPAQALRMAAALLEHRHPFRLLFYEGGDHGLTEHEAEVLGQIRAWLDRYVRDRRPWPSPEPHGA